jgi:hypothetical protein
MIYTWFLSRLLDWRTWAILALLAVIGTSIYKTKQSSFNAGVAQSAEVVTALQNQINLDRELYAQSILESSKTQTEWMTKYQNAEHRANEQIKSLQIINAQSTGIIDRLRDTTKQANERINLPNTPKDTTDEYVAALTNVFNDCTGKYVEMAKVADQYEIDQQKLIDSYPAN